MPGFRFCPLLNSPCSRSALLYPDATVCLHSPLESQHSRHLNLSSASRLSLVDRRSSRPPKKGTNFPAFAIRLHQLALLDNRQKIIDHDRCFPQLLRCAFRFVLRQRDCGRPFVNFCGDFVRRDYQYRRGFKDVECFLGDRACWAGGKVHFLVDSKTFSRGRRLRRLLRARTDSAGSNLQLNPPIHLAIEDLGRRSQRTGPD
jgi:hypothetical protein